MKAVFIDAIDSRHPVWDAGAAESCPPRTHPPEHGKAWRTGSLRRLSRSCNQWVV